MNTPGNKRFISIAIVLAACIFWSFAAAGTKTGEAYPNGRFLTTGQWLVKHLEDPTLIVVDVRDDKYFDGRLIPGAVRMPYSLFREDDPAEGIGERFVGTVRAQEILGRHGIGREHTVVLYDSVKRDGGATSSYVFWVLDLLGHKKMMLLDRGVDGWADAGGKIAASPAEPEPVLYQAMADEIDLRRIVDADFIYSRLGDPHYTILDVRSADEYSGDAANNALGGGPLKLGHVPTAVNFEYKLNWTDKESKKIKSYGELQQLYKGLSPADTVITYCHSARRGSFSYFILRLMGFEQVTLYESSWFEWGSPERFYPVERTERKLIGANLPGVSSPSTGSGTATSTGAAGTQKSSPAAGGYVSCGG